MLTSYDMTTKISLCLNEKRYLNIQLQCKERLDVVCGVVSLTCDATPKLSPEDIADGSASVVGHASNCAFITTTNHLKAVKERQSNAILCLFRS